MYVPSTNVMLTHFTINNYTENQTRTQEVESQKFLDLVLV